MRNRELHDKVKSIVELFPHTKGSNTELYITFLEKELKHDLPEKIKEMMRKFKPESVTRARRFLTPPTDQQQEQESEYRKNYKKTNFN